MLRVNWRCWLVPRVLGHFLARTPTVQISEPQRRLDRTPCHAHLLGEFQKAQNRTSEPTPQAPVGMAARTCRGRVNILDYSTRPPSAAILSIPCAGRSYLSPSSGASSPIRTLARNGHLGSGAMPPLSAPH